MDAKSQSAEHSAEDQTTWLVARLRRDDPEAGALLDSLYRDALLRFCWGYLGRMDEAEDAVQDICYKVLSSRHIPDIFRPWLYRIARNHCLNLLRERASRKDGQALRAASQLHDTLTGHLTRMVKDEMRSQVAELVGKLSEAQREVLQLRYVEGLVRAEIADVLELPESVVKSRLFEGLKRLREYASMLGES